MDLRKEMDVRVPYFPSDLRELQSLGHFWTQTTNSVIASCKDMFFLAWVAAETRHIAPKTLSNSWAIGRMLDRTSLYVLQNTGEPQALPSPEEALLEQAVAARW